MVPLEVSGPVTAAVRQRCVRVGRAMAALTDHELTGLSPATRCTSSEGCPEGRAIGAGWCGLAP